MEDSIFMEVAKLVEKEPVGTEEELKEHLRMYFQMKSELAKLQELEKSMRTKIDNIMKKLDIPRFESDDLGAVYYETRRIERIDTKRLKKELPDLYRTYAIVKETTYLKIINARELQRRKEFAKRRKR